jgi:hypothetical protein
VRNPGTIDKLSLQRLTAHMDCESPLDGALDALQSGCALFAACAALLSDDPGQDDALRTGRLWQRGIDQCERGEACLMRTRCTGRATSRAGDSHFL